MTLLNFIRGLFYVPTISIYRECTGREWTLRPWVRSAQEVAKEAGIVFAALAAFWLYMHA